MPLIEGDPSDKAREENIRILIKEGKKPEQAVAIAYDIQRKAHGGARNKPDKKMEK